MNDETSLVLAGRGELAHVTGAANSLVARGLAELQADSVSALLPRMEDSRQVAQLALERFTAFKKELMADIENHLEEGAKYYVMDDNDKAILEFDAVIALDQCHVEAHACRGFAWWSKMNYGKALQDFESAVRLNPNDAEACSCLAWVLATCPDGEIRDGGRAVQLARQACDLTNWEGTNFLDTLAAAYAELGEYDEAQRFEIMAVEAADYEGKAGSIFKERLELYKQQKPLRLAK